MKRLFFILGFLLIFAMPNKSLGAINIAILSDTVYTQENPYNWYFKTPDVLLQDIYDNLAEDANLHIIPYSEVKSILLKKPIKQQNIATMRNFNNSYSVDFEYLKKVSKQVGCTKILFVTSDMDVQRDFLKSTLWDRLNVPGFDVVNPTHRITFYAVLVDTKFDKVIWEGIYAKNIRNNKMKNLDTITYGNYEGAMRIKRYSKFVSPEIAQGVRESLGLVSSGDKIVGTGREFVYAVNKKVRIGSSKDLLNVTGTLDTYFANYDAQVERMEAKRAVKAEKKRAKQELKLQEKQEKEEIKLELKREKDAIKLQNYEIKQAEKARNEAQKNEIRINNLKAKQIEQTRKNEIKLQKLKEEQIKQEKKLKETQEKNRIKEIKLKEKKDFQSSEWFSF